MPGDEMSETFALDISKFAKKFGIEANVVARKIIFDIQRDVMLATPVDTGMLRSSWFVGIGTPSTAKAMVPDAGAAAKGQAQAALGAFKWGNTAYITNNLPYAHRIEFEGWSHTKAPAGMVRITVARYQAQFGRWS